MCLLQRVSSSREDVTAISNHMFAYQGDVQGHLAACIQGMLNVCLSGDLIVSRPMCCSEHINYSAVALCN